MKKTILFALLCFVSTTVVFAQTKSQRRIYLWDVTLSMHGERCVSGSADSDPSGKNIYNEVRKFLIQDIESITDESTEIVVLPFQEDILDEWREKADVEGKRDIIQKIERYPKQGCSWTNIVRPMERVQTSIISSDKNNLLVLLTDGVQSDKYGGKEKLIEWIQLWSQYAERNFAYCLYVMLGEGVDKDLQNEIDKETGIEWTDKLGIQMVDLQPADLVKINVKDDKIASIPLTYKRSIVLPDNIGVLVTAEDSILNINQKVIVKDGKITFDMKYQTEASLQENQLPETTRLPLQIELINKDEIIKTAGKIIYLTKSQIELELINKPEKTLKISIKK